MKFKPDDNWRWFYDEQHDRMMLDLANGSLFCSRFSSKVLIPDAFIAAHFTIEDVANFFLFNEQCRHLFANDDLCATLTFNALVALRFHKPLMPKSWYFAPQQQWHPTKGNLVEVICCDNEEKACLLVVESGDQASLCLLAQYRLQLNTRRMVLGDAIKIMNNRLLPMTNPAACHFAFAV